MNLNTLGRDIKKKELKIYLRYYFFFFWEECSLDRVFFLLLFLSFESFSLLR